jgi:hypothetical protein
MSAILHPVHYRIIKRSGTLWRVKGSPLCNQEPIGLRGIGDYGLTVEQLFISLFRINGGCAGYYLVNLETKVYYYCGPESEAVRAKLRSLGIDRADP